MEKINKLPPFINFCYTIGMIPTSYKVSLTYEEQLLWLCKFLEDTVIPEVNNTGKAVEELQALYVELKNYVDEYFDNLDVQTEINNKLDDMAESGQLAEIIAQFLNLQFTYTFSDVSDMLSSSEITDGSVCQTLGFHEAGDLGGAKYIIREIENTDVVDNMFLFAIVGSNTLVAEKLKEDKLNVKSIGAYGDGTNDDSLVLEKAFNSGESVYIPNGEYVLNQRIDILQSAEISGESKTNTKIVMPDNLVGDFSSFIASNQVDNIKIRNLSFDGGTQATARYILSLLECDGLVLDNIKINDGLGYSIRIHDNTNTTITNCEFENTHGVDGNPGGAIYGQNVKNLVVDNCKGNVLDDHLLYIAGITEAENITISNSYVYKSGNQAFTNGGAINLYANVKNVTITNCIFEECKDGVHISKYADYLTTPKNVVVTNCVFNDCINQAVFMEGLTDAPVEDVNIANCSIYNITAQDGIGIRDAKNINVANCIMNKIYRNAIDVRYGEHVNIQANLIKNANVGIMTGNSSTADKIVIKDNIVDSDLDYTGNHTIGVYVRSTSTNCVVENNIIANCTTFNINVQGTGHIVRNQTTNDASQGNLVGSLLYGSATPTNGTWKKGDMVINTAAAVGSPFAWICTTEGTPGTWKALANIS